MITYSDGHFGVWQGWKMSKRLNRNFFRRDLNLEYVTGHLVPSEALGQSPTAPKIP